MKFTLFLIVLYSFISCSNQEEVEKDVFNQTIINDKKNLTFEKRVKREIEAKLSIPATEKYTLKIEYAHLNSDEKKDAIITVNRLQFAMDEGAKSGNMAKIEKLGYMGNYNYFFFYDGKLDKISVPMLVPSSAKTPLKVNFKHIQSNMYQDVMIDYRIRNSAFRNYYLIENGTLQIVFQWKLFDQLGLDSYEANYIEYQTGSISLAKDILIYKGKIKNYSTKINDVYSYNPTIEKQNELLYRFFYDPKTMKYMTKNK